MTCFMSETWNWIDCDCLCSFHRWPRIDRADCRGAVCRWEHHWDIGLLVGCKYRFTDLLCSYRFRINNEK